MEWLLWIGGFLVVLQVGDGIGDIMKAYAKRIKGTDPKSVDALRAEIKSLADRLDTTERAALEAEDKVRFLERLLNAPAGAPPAAELPAPTGDAGRVAAPGPGD